MISSKSHPVAGLAFCIFSVVAVLGSGVAIGVAQERFNASASDKNWRAVAPGRVEPWSGEIRVGSTALGRVGEVMVKVNDMVFAGEALLRIEDEEVRTRHAKAELQANLRRRARPTSQAKGADRRRVEDAAADAEHAVVEARKAVDRAAAAKRASDGSDDSLAAAQKSLASSRELLQQRQEQLVKFEADAPPIPTELEGPYAMARLELRGAEAALDNLVIRAPLAGTVLQVNIRTGELAGPTSLAPLVVVGDIAKLRVRTEVDERDFGEIKVGQPVIVRSQAFPGRDVAGTVASIAPMIEPGRIGARGQRNLTDVNVAEVVVDLAQTGPLAVGMRVDVYFPRDGAPR